MRSIDPRRAVFLAACAAVMAAAEPVAWAGPFDCASMNPENWPAAAKPYVLLMVSTSSSMSLDVGGATPASCTSANATSYGVDRRAHTRCALKNAVEAHSSAVNFGLATFARTISGCADDSDGLCDFSSCTHANLSGSADASCAMNIGCGAEPNPAALNSSSRGGAFFRVAVPSQAADAPDNVASLVAWVDGSCADSRELFASGCMPLNGMLRDAFRYYADQWVPPAPVPGGAPLLSPLTSLALGERPCRDIDAILITDGDESCDASADAVDAAADLFAGFTKDGITWRVKTHVIRFSGGSAVNADAIAAAGGTVSAVHVEDEAQLTSALAAIVASAVISETCDNADNDCNGCIDEGFVHYCHQAQPCCAWATMPQRATCLAQFEASLVDDPDGDPSFLPCTTPGQQMNSATWLCQDPGESCDGIDNNCSSAADEGCLGLPCEEASACQSGFCVDEVCCDAACGGGGAEDCVACSVSAGSASDGSCAPLTAGTPCEDGDACTLGDVCQAEVCMSAERVLCPPPDGCHEAPTCTPDTGTCEYAAKADGSPCEDADPCTQDDACAAGTCVAGPPVQCDAQDDCHDAVCDPSTGTCSGPSKPDGAPCSGGTCSNGACVDMTPTSSNGDGGVTVTDGGVTGTDAGTGGASTGPDQASHDGGGCGCRGDASTPTGILVTVAFAMTWRRSRRGSRAPRS